MCCFFVNSLFCVNHSEVVTGDLIFCRWGGRWRRSRRGWGWCRTSAWPAGTPPPRTTCCPSTSETLETDVNWFVLYAWTSTHHWNYCPLLVYSRRTYLGLLKHSSFQFGLSRFKSSTSLKVSGNLLSYAFQGKRCKAPNFCSTPSLKHISFWSNSILELHHVSSPHLILSPLKPYNCTSLDRLLTRHSHPFHLKDFLTMLLHLSTC